MEKIKKILKERASGLLLLLFAGLIVAGLSSDFSYAGSDKGQNQPEGEQMSSEEQVRGDEEDSLENDVQEIMEENSDVPEEPATEAKEASDEEVGDKSVPDPEKSRCDELRRLLKKYCGKNYNVKKCRDYLIETKDLSKKDEQCKSLYKKYHFEPKKDNRSNDDSTSASTEATVTTSLVIKAGGNSKSYSVASSPNASVIDLMGLAGVTYNRTGTICAGCMNNINGMGENQGNMSWMLYLCKNGECHLSSAGASECKIDNWDEIEWRYLDWTEISSDEWLKLW